MTLEGQRILVVGGSSGIGLAASQAFSKEGALLVIASRSSAKLAAAKSRISGPVEAYPLDYSDEPAVKRFFAQLGGFDHLVITAAGRPAWGEFLTLNPESLQGAMNTKFWGSFLCARYAIPNIRKDGSITFFVGGACRTAIPGTAGLAAVNGAIMAMAHTLAKELAPLRVNTISPGIVDTEAYAWMSTEERKLLYEKMSRSLPVGRVGLPDDLAEAAVFVVKSTFVTGAVLDIDGGARL
jgi:NAD(P)-dependent dehydrogenase (short-subunit alcohol dehydrogenase family)